MIQFSFPTIYWHFHIGKINFESLKEKCLPTTEWSCSVKTSREVSYNWDNFFKQIKPAFQQLPFKQDKSLIFETPWLNVYSKGDYQEPHHHLLGQNVLSYCYFSELPKDSGKFSFFNEQYRNYCCNDFINCLTIGNEIVEWGSPEVNEGDLIIFPSFLIHQVTYHKSEKPRITVSGNIKVQ